MSRRKPEKSDMPRIGIFTDKSANYNLAILKTLYKQGSATAWQIAKKLCYEPKLNEEVLDSRARKIYSVIQRKKGRLIDLVAKGYIGVNGKKYELGLKGRLALALREPGFLEANKKAEDRDIERFKQIIDSMPDNVVRTDFGFSIDLALFKKTILETVDAITNNPKVFQEVLNETNKLLLAGIDLDRIDITNLAMMLSQTQPIQQLRQAGVDTHEQKS